MIKLYKNNTYQWFKKDNVNTIGYAFYKDSLYEDEKLANFIYQSKENLETILQDMNGYFSIVIEEDECIILVSDIIRSFPVFYNNKGDISDDIDVFKRELNELSIEELQQARWVSGDDTIYQNVKQLENASIVYLYKNGHTEKKKYFRYKYVNNASYSFKELDIVFQKMIDRTIKYLNGRTAVIPLSGGGDSRLLAYYLKEKGYKNIITYTYGSERFGEVETSKKIAKFLNLPWYFVEYNEKKCKKIYNDKKMHHNIMDYLGNGYSIPHIQELEAVYELLDKKIINKECVILPGFSLGFLTGSHVNQVFLNTDKTDVKVVLEKIYANNYNLTKKDNSIFDGKLKKLLELQEGTIDSRKGADCCEQYDFEERQAKFINNAIRVYDYFGMKWYLPFWDKDLIAFWEKVSLKDKYKKDFFIRFCNYKYGDLMNYAPLWHRTKRKLSSYKKISLIWKNYYQNPLNFFYYFGFKKYLKYVILERNFNYDYYAARDYVNYIKEEKKNGV